MDAEQKEWLLEQAEKACDFVEAVPFDAWKTLAVMYEGRGRFKELAKAWRLEHPHDDDEPITLEWLELIGGELLDSDGGEMVWFRIAFGDLLWKNEHAIPPFCKYKGVELEKTPQNKGEFRRLCKALGIELREPKS